MVVGGLDGAGDLLAVLLLELVALGARAGGEREDEEPGGGAAHDAQRAWDLECGSGHRIRILLRLPVASLGHWSSTTFPASSPFIFLKSSCRPYLPSSKFGEVFRSTSRSANDAFLYWPSSTQARICQ